MFLSVCALVGLILSLVGVLVIADDWRKRRRQRDELRRDMSGDRSTRK